MHRARHSSGEKHRVLSDPDLRTLYPGRHSVLGQLLAQRGCRARPNFLGSAYCAHHDNTEFRRGARADRGLLCQGHGRLDLCLPIFCVRRTSGIRLGQCFQPSRKPAEIGARFTCPCQRKCTGTTLNNYSKILYFLKDSLFKIS